MNFSFYDLVDVRLEPSLRSLGKYFEQEFGAFRKPADKPPKSIIEFRPLSPNEGPSAGFDASVGGMMYKRGDVYYINDGRDRYAEWIEPQAGGDHVVIRIDPQFKPYRAYYYVVLPLLKLFFNRHGCTFIHSAAVEMDGKRYALCGWGGTGKTNTLLRLIERGAVYLSDDLTVVDRQGNLYPFPRSINVYHYNLEGVPGLARRMTRRQRMRARIASIGGALASSILPRHRYFVTIAQKKLSGSSIPSSWVNAESQSVAGKPAAVVALLYSGAPRSSPASVECTETEDIAAACLANIMYEFQSIQALYSMYGFLAGARPAVMVGGEDFAIIREFLANSRIAKVSVPPGHAFEPVDLLQLG